MQVWAHFKHLPWSSTAFSLFAENDVPWFSLWIMNGSVHILNINSTNGSAFFKVLWGQAPPQCSPFGVLPLNSVVNRSLVWFVDIFPISLSHTYTLFLSCSESNEGVFPSCCFSQSLDCLSTMKPCPQRTQAPATKETNRVVCQLAVTDHSSNGIQLHRQGHSALTQLRLESAGSLQEETQA